MTQSDPIFFQGVDDRRGFMFLHLLIAIILLSHLYHLPPFLSLFLGWSWLEQMSGDASMAVTISGVRGSFKFGVFDTFLTN